MSAPTVVEGQMAIERKTMSKKTSDQVSSEIVDSTAEETDLRKLGTDMNYKFESRNRLFHIFLILLHLSALLGLFHSFTGAKIATVIWAAVMTVLGVQSVVLGAHRAFSHRSFKPSKSLKLALIFFHSTTGQNTIIWWARDHRVHHKYTDTDADPYNSTRGFWFSHLWWYLVKKHPLVIEKSKQFDFSDLLEDKWLMFQKRSVSDPLDLATEGTNVMRNLRPCQRGCYGAVYMPKYFWILHVLNAFIFPTIVPMYVWNETFKYAFTVAYCLRVVIILHCISSINSFAHMYGTRPFDKRINPVQSELVHWLTGGDGWHNFHHCFPWDYGLGEFGYGKGLSTLAIEFFAKYGFASDLKKASLRVVEGHSKRHGDGSPYNY